MGDVRGAELERWCSEFAPDVVLLDGLYGGAVATDLSRRARVPLWYRPQYRTPLHGGTAHAGTRVARRIGLAANCLGLERFERDVIRRARRVFDISRDDAAYWRECGMAHVEWLPTLVDEDYIARLEAAKVDQPEFDILYFGNLNTPNNGRPRPGSSATYCRTS